MRWRITRVCGVYSPELRSEVLLCKAEFSVIYRNWSIIRYRKQSIIHSFHYYFHFYLDLSLVICSSNPSLATKKSEAVCYKVID